MAYGDAPLALTDAIAHLAGGVAALRPDWAEAVPVEAALGRWPAGVVPAAEPLPAHSLAARDGFALRARDVDGASLYAPIWLRLAAGHARKVVSGDALLAGEDAVVSARDTPVDGEAISVMEAVPAGHGVWAEGSEIRQGAALLEPERALNRLDLARLRLAGHENVPCGPRVRVSLAVAETAAAHAAASLMCGILGPLIHVRPEAGTPGSRPPSLRLVVGVPAGSATAAEWLDAEGRCDVPAIALSPGSETALGRIGDDVVVVLPALPWPAAVVTWALLRPGLAPDPPEKPRLPPRCLPLLRKVSSPLGWREVVPVAIRDQAATPLPRGLRSPPLGTDGTIVIAAGSEGFHRGASGPVQSLDELGGWT